MRTLSLVASLVVLTLAGQGQPMAGNGTYTLTELVPPGEERGFVRRLSENGTVLVAGTKVDPKDKETQIVTHYRWKDGQFTKLLSVRANFQPQPSAISPNGKIAGECSRRFNGELRYIPVVWKSEKAKRIAAPMRERLISPSAIGQSGLVAGNTSQTDKPWTSKGKRFKWLPFPFLASGASISSLNRDDVLVGTAHYEDTGLHQPVFWQNGEAKELEVPDPYNRGQAHDINDSKQIVGEAGLLGSHITAPLIWDSEAVSVIEVFGGDQGSAVSINNLGRVVGSGRLSGPNAISHGFLWSAIGGAVDLNDLLSPKDQALWEIELGYAINDDGWILVQADTRSFPSKTHQFLMRPTP